MNPKVRKTRLSFVSLWSMHIAPKKGIFSAQPPPPLCSLWSQLTLLTGRNYHCASNVHKSRRGYFACYQHFKLLSAIWLINANVSMRVGHSHSSFSAVQVLPSNIFKDGIKNKLEMRIFSCSFEFDSCIKSAVSIVKIAKVNRFSSESNGWATMAEAAVVDSLRRWICGCSASSF